MGTKILFLIGYIGELITRTHSNIFTRIKSHILKACLKSLGLLIKKFQIQSRIGTVNYFLYAYVKFFCNISKKMYKNN